MKGIKEDKEMTATFITTAIGVVLAMAAVLAVGLPLLSIFEKWKKEMDEDE